MVTEKYEKSEQSQEHVVHQAEALIFLKPDPDDCGAGGTALLTPSQESELITTSRCCLLWCADKVSLDAGTRSVIAVSGIPPVNGFDRHTVLAIVQRHDPGATLLA